MVKINLYGYDEQSHEKAKYSVGQFSLSDSNDDTLEDREFVLIINHSNISFLMKMFQLAVSKKPRTIEIKYYSLINRSFDNIFEMKFFTIVLPEILKVFDSIDDSRDIVRFSTNNPLNEMLGVNASLSSLHSDFPKTLCIELTRNCNSSCIMCNRKDSLFRNNDVRYNMPFSLFKMIADGVFPLVDLIDLRGFGESALHPDFKKMVNYAGKFNKRLRLISNLNFSKEIADVLLSNKVQIIVSIDSHKKSLYESIRIGCNFDTLVENINYLVSQNANVSSITVVQEKNKEDIKKIKNFLFENGITQNKFVPDRRLEDPSEIKKLILNGSKVEVDEGVKSEKICCQRPWQEVFISYNGLVGPCSHLMEPLLYLGDLAKDSFEAIWNNEVFKIFRKVVKEKKADTCSWCVNNDVNLLSCDDELKEVRDV